MHRDLTWLMTFLPVFNGTTTYNHCSIEQNETLHIDACLEGVGGVWKRNICLTKIPNHLKNDCRLNTTHEMKNIVVALNLWGVKWSGKKVLIKTDNMAVVSICITGYTRDNQQHMPGTYGCSWPYMA